LRIRPDNDGANVKATKVLRIEEFWHSFWFLINSGALRLAPFHVAQQNAPYWTKI
jgi:hypothetical protein